MGLFQLSYWREYFSSMKFKIKIRKSEFKKEILNLSGMKKNNMKELTEVDWVTGCIDCKKMNFLKRENLMKNIFIL